MDIELLQLLGNRDKFQRYHTYVKRDTLAPETALIFEWLGDWFSDKRNDALPHVHWPAFGSQHLLTTHKKLTPDQHELLRKVFARLDSWVPATLTDTSILDYFITQDYATRVGAAAIDVLDGKEEDFDAVLDLVNQYDKAKGRAVLRNEIFVDDDALDIADEIASTGLVWRLGELNVALGPVRQGDFVLIAARPETGKTTLLASEASHMAGQIASGRPIIWVNNEERSKKVKFRIQQAALGWTTTDMLSDLAATQAAYQKAIGTTQILVLSETSGINSVKQLTTLFRDYDPSLIIFDQLDKVYGFEDDKRDDLRIAHLYRWAREMAHKYGPVIAASQCDASAENEQWIFMNQLRGSKTDKPGEVDAIVTIGRVSNPLKKYERYIHVPKNKLFGGGAKFSEAERHGMFTVDIEPEIARYKGKL